MLQLQVASWFGAAVLPKDGKRMVIRPVKLGRGSLVQPVWPKFVHEWWSAWGFDRVAVGFLSKGCIDGGEDCGHCGWVELRVGERVCMYGFL